ncbi:MAG: hypothetical protein ABIR51_03650 [Sphingomicrobium sp.]
MTSPHAYRLFGLTVHSALELPELQPALPADAPDLVIELGEVAMPDASDQAPQPIDGGSAIRVEGVARYAIRDGSRITVDPTAGAAARNVRLYLLGSAMGMLLHQRGILPLHANAVEVDGRAFAFMGASGAGKSTLAAWFHDRGFGIISDDVCAIRFDPSGHPMTGAGLPRLRLWREAIERSGRDPADFPRSYSGDETYDKYDVAVAPHLAGRQEIEVAAVYLMRVAAAPAISRLAGVATVEALFANTYRGAYVADSDQQRTHWQACVDLADRVPVFALDRVPGFARLDEEIDSILAHARHLAAARRVA